MSRTKLFMMVPFCDCVHWYAHQYALSKYHFTITQINRFQFGYLGCAFSLTSQLQTVDKFHLIYVARMRSSYELIPMLLLLNVSLLQSLLLLLLLLLKLQLKTKSWSVKSVSTRLDKANFWIRGGEWFNELMLTNIKENNTERDFQAH